MLFGCHLVVTKAHANSTAVFENALTFMANIHLVFTGYVVVVNISPAIIYQTLGNCLVLIGEKRYQAMANFRS
jgi:hypothetical protein